MKNIIPLLCLALFINSASAQESPLCSDLARFSCAPGNYKDGTGEVKSDAEIQQAIALYSKEIHNDIADRINTAIHDPENPYFRELAVAALGLKNSPDCTDKAPERQIECDKNLSEGLTKIAEGITLGPLVPNSGLTGRGDFKGVFEIVKSATFMDLLLEMNKRLQTDLGKPEMLSKVEKQIFPRVKQLILERIDRLKVPDEQKTFMKTKLKSIGFDGTDCTKIAATAQQSNLAANLLQTNAFYDPDRNRFTFCAGYLLQSNSEFSLAFVIAHELFHSLDPCRIGQGPADLGFKYSEDANLEKMESEYPLTNVVKCLRNPNSVGAINLYSLAQAKAMVVNSPYPNFSYYTPNAASPNARAKKLNDSGYSAPYPYGASAAPQKITFCDKDQLTEAVPDWMALEVLPEYVKKFHPQLTLEQKRIGYSNALRLFCQILPDNPAAGPKQFDEHPEAENRINKILLVQPQIREQMGCSGLPKFNYCDSDKVPQMPEPQAAPMAIPGVIHKQNGNEGVK